METPASPICEMSVQKQKSNNHWSSGKWRKEVRQSARRFLSRWQHLTPGTNAVKVGSVGPVEAEGRRKPAIESAGDSGGAAT